MTLKKVKRIDRKAHDYGQFKLLKAGSKTFSGTVDESFFPAPRSGL
jgi:hypothetical protein